MASDFNVQDEAPSLGTVTTDSEFPAAAALSDTTANPTAPMVGSACMIWTGSVWLRMPGTLADGTLVNLGANNDVTVATLTTGGCDLYSRISTNDENSAAVKASAGTVYGIQCFNKSATVPAYLKLYNKATGPSEADTPVQRLMIPAAASNLGAGHAIPIPPQGWAFGTGIGIRVVAGIADNDDTAIAAAEVLVNIQYK